MASDQIRQMVNFILQEAHEKANEIRVKVRLTSHGSFQLITSNELAMTRGKFHTVLDPLFKTIQTWNFRRCHLNHLNRDTCDILDDIIYT
jgi:hypothetical protein